MDERLLSLVPQGAGAYAVPDWGHPRVVFAAESASQRRRYASALTASTLGGRALRAVRICGAWAGWRRADNPGTGWPLGEWIADTVPSAETGIAIVGPPGPAQKVVVRLLDGSGEVAGYVKLGWQPAARERVARETAILRSASDGLGPRVLKAGSWRGAETLVLEAVPGRWARRSPEPEPAALDLLRRLAAGPACDVGDHPLLASLEGDVEAAPIVAQLSGRSWPVCVQHGDAAPWNCLIDDAGGARLIDWEYAREASLPGLDLAYWALQVTHYVSRWPPARSLEVAAAILETAGGVERTVSRPLVRLASLLAFRQEVDDGCSPDDATRSWRRQLWRTP